MSYASLPAEYHKFVEGSFSETPIDDTLHDESDIMDGSYRAVTTKQRFTASWTYRAQTTAAMLTMRSFVRDTVNGTLLPFYWTHPLTDETHLVRFATVPTWVRNGAGLYDYAISVRVI